jgi:hypothetical protein
MGNNTSKSSDIDLFKIVHEPISNTTYGMNNLTLYRNGNLYEVVFTKKKGSIHIIINEHTLIVNCNHELYDNELVSLVRNTESALLIPNGLHRGTIGAYDIDSLLMGKLKLVRNIDKDNYAEVNKNNKKTTHYKNNIYDFTRYKRIMLPCNIDGDQAYMKYIQTKYIVKTSYDNGSIILECMNDKQSIHTAHIDINPNTYISYDTINNIIALDEYTNNKNIRTIYDINMYAFCKYLEYIHNMYYSQIVTKYHTIDSVNCSVIIRDLHNDHTYNIDPLLRGILSKDDVSIGVSGNMSYDNNKRSFELFQDILLNKEIDYNVITLHNYYVYNLLEHLYEYSRVFELNNEMIMYIGYRILHIVTICISKMSHNGLHIDTKMNNDHSIYTNILKRFRFNFQPYDELVNILLNKN